MTKGDDHHDGLWLGWVVVENKEKKGLKSHLSFSLDFKKQLYSKNRVGIVHIKSTYDYPSEPPTTTSSVGIGK